MGTSNKTSFRPSIHGWPFSNSGGFETVRFEFLGEMVSVTRGFCGGMSWRALQRFYNAIPIYRDLPKPARGDDLFEELYEAQLSTMTYSYVHALFNLQCRPDLDGSNILFPIGLGTFTQWQWRSIKHSLDMSMPVSITLINDSNNYNPFHLSSHHQVVAYAYRTALASQTDTAPRGAKEEVTLWIYDPNDPNNNSACLTFFLGADKGRIRLRYNGDNRYHGFLMHDVERGYRLEEVNDCFWVNKCEQIRITSAKWAEYRLKISWTSRIVPYFEVLIDDEAWAYNSDARGQYAPTNDNMKQCPSQEGELTVTLRLPRRLSTVIVRFLEDDDLARTQKVDATPAFYCYPYLHNRAEGKEPYVFDKTINEDDLFIRHQDPPDAEIERLNASEDSEFRWIMQYTNIYHDSRVIGAELSRASVEVTESKRLGNVVVPIFANFVAKNLAAPKSKIGMVKIFRTGEPDTMIDLDHLADRAQKIFDGFLKNPTDYDHDTRVEFTYTFKDEFDIEATGRTMFFGQTIIYEFASIGIEIFEASRLAKVELVAKRLIELGLVDLVINQPGERPDPLPRSGDPSEVLRKLREQRQLQSAIDIALKLSLDDQQTQRQIWDSQLKYLQQVGKNREVEIENRTKKEGLLGATNELKESLRKDVDSFAITIAAKEAIDRLEQNPDIRNILENLLEGEPR